MKLKILFLAALVATVAYAGTRRVSTMGAVPTQVTDGGTYATTDGVPLTPQAAACRRSASVEDGGTMTAVTLQTYYFDANLGWTRSSTQLDCVLETGTLIDAGTANPQVCPDVIPGAKFGRTTTVSTNPGKATITTECWGVGYEAN